MSRSERLFDLLHALRGHRRPISGKVLADAIGVSIRTLYRDIASLQALGAAIEGEPGVGYVLKPGFLLPPLMFTPEEIEALVLGSRWVAARADDPLREAARSALTRIAAVLPIDLRDELDASALLIGPGATIPTGEVDPALLRKAIRTERKLALRYRDGAGAASEWVVWPFALAFFDSVRVLLGWCELRQGFRHFRTDRIVSATPIEVRYARMFFDRPDYDLASARPGSFAIVPSDGMIDLLRRDYDNTVAMIFGTPPTFDAIHASLLAIEEAINRNPPS